MMTGDIPDVGFCNPAILTSKVDDMVKNDFFWIDTFQVLLTIWDIVFNW